MQFQFSCTTTSQEHVLKLAGQFSFCFPLGRTTTSMAVSMKMTFHLQRKQTAPCHRRAAVHGSLSEGHGEWTIARTSRTKIWAPKNDCDMSRCSTSQEWVSKCFKIIIGETPQHKSTILLQRSTNPVDPSMRISYFQGFTLRWVGKVTNHKWIHHDPFGKIMPSIYIELRGIFPVFCWATWPPKTA